MKGKRTHFNPYATKMNTTTAVIFTIFFTTLNLYRYLNNYTYGK